MDSPELIDEGSNALRILGVANAVTTLLAIAPTYLKHSGENRLLFRTVAVAAAVQVALLIVLVPRVGATGAALAYAVATIAMYGNLARLARRSSLHLRASRR